MSGTEEKSRLIGLLGFFLAFLCAGAIPIYGLPFNGCTQYGYNVLDPHCSPWPEFFRGFLFVAIVGLATFGRLIWPLIALSMAVLVTVLGGADAVHSALAIPASLSEVTKSGLLHGAISASVLCSAITLFAKHARTSS